MALRFFAGRSAPAEPTAAVAAPPRPSVSSRVFSPFRAVGHGLSAAFNGLDRGFCWLAIPFGVRVQNRLGRYGLMMGTFGGIYLLGALHLHFLSLSAILFR